MGSDSGVRAFYRSRLFWFGAVVFLFLTWVWWDSGRMATEVRWELGERACGGAVGDGTVSWGLTTYFEGYKGAYEISGKRYRIHKGKRGFAFRAAFESTNYEVNGTWSTDWWVAMWVVMMVYGVMWMGVVVWWQRRRVKRMVAARGVVGDSSTPPA